MVVLVVLVDLALRAVFLGLGFVVDFLVWFGWFWLVWVLLCLWVLRAGLHVV